MGITKTLWEILDHQRQEPAILDSRDAGTSNHFAKARPFRWKVGVRAALVLVAGFLVVVVGAPGCESCLSAVFLGDLGEKPQRIVMGREDFAPVDVVKVSHHGSRDQFEGLYRVLSAEIGLIGVGEENTYGHPTRGALEILEASGTTPLRSDERGIVTVSSTATGKLTIWSER